MSNQSFLKGTVILIIANAISKILGAVFKIPLAHILKEEGMAIFNTAFLIYSVMLSFVISGFPTAISNITAKHYALKNFPYIKRLASVSSLILALSGLIMSLIMFFFSDFFAFVMKDPEASLAIKVISPSVFFVALSTVYKGFFQGSVNMIPTAISQVVESIVRLLIGFFAAFLLVKKSIVFASAGALFGITFGEILATSMLYLMFLYSAKKLPKTGLLYPRKKAYEEILKIALPMFICSAFISGLNMIDTSVVRSCLTKIQFTPETSRLLSNRYSQYTHIFKDLPDTLKMSLSGSRWLYGAYSGYAMTVFNLPSGIISSLGVSILPVITNNITTKNTLAAEKTAALALKLTSLIAFPFCFGMLFFSKPVLMLLFNTDAASPLLATLAPTLIFLSVSQLFSTLLHAAGFIISPALCTVLGMIVKIILDIILIPNPNINIFGAPISSCFAYFIMMLLYYYLIKKHLKFRFSFKETILNPLICSLFMIMFMYFILNPLVFFIGEKIGFLLCCSFGISLYLCILLLTGVFPLKEKLAKRK